MPDYYPKNYKAYHEKTFSIDPSSFLAPLAQRLPSEAFILDVGCGSGRDLLWTKRKGFDVIGFERSPGLAELARDNVGCEVIEGDFETYDFSSIFVDAIMLVGALVHVPNERFSKVFENIALTLQKSRMVQVRGVKVEAVVVYCEPLTTKEMEYYRLSCKVNNMVKKTIITGNNKQLVS
jgi:SAM-dependent methyltransferase